MATPTAARRIASTGDAGSELGSLDALLARVKGEFDEMPGMNLTPRQAQRLWQLDEPTCTHLLTTLVERRFLLLTPRGTFIKRG